MKKLNNKGFTLVELLTVLLILIAILAIAIPNISAALSRSEKKQLEAQKESIAAEALINIKKKDFPSELSHSYTAFKNAVCFLSVETLITKKYISEDSLKNKKYNISGCVGYDRTGDFKFFENGKSYAIKYYDESGVLKNTSSDKKACDFLCF